LKEGELGILRAINSENTNEKEKLFKDFVIFSLPK
jgi:hypothetical protein